MRRKRRRKTMTGGLLIIVVAFGVFILYLLLQAIQYLLENPWMFALLASPFILYYVVQLVIYLHKKKTYEETPYYLETQLPYRYLKKPGVQFEQEVFNDLKTKIPDALMIVNALFARADSINEHFEIDLIVFTQKGIFVLELKDWKGYIYGGSQQKNWSIGYAGEGSKKVRNVYNPLLQNKKHVEDLKKLYRFTYIGKLIFSKRGDIGTPSNQLQYLDQFMSEYDQLEYKHMELEVKNCYTALNALLCREDLQKHKDRITYNKMKYGS